jgi:hypothetical protein
MVYGGGEQAEPFQEILQLNEDSPWQVAVLKDVKIYSRDAESPTSGSAPSFAAAGPFLFLRLYLYICPRTVPAVLPPGAGRPEALPRLRE